MESNSRRLEILFALPATIGLFGTKTLADAVAPTPKQTIGEQAAGAGTYLGAGLFVLAGVLIVVWIFLKLSKRASK